GNFRWCASTRLMRLARVDGVSCLLTIRKGVQKWGSGMFKGGLGGFKVGLRKVHRDYDEVHVGSAPGSRIGGDMGRSFSLSAALALVIAACVMSSATVLTQGKPQTAANAASAKTSNARDLQGVWSFATLTPLQRPKEFTGRDKLTAEEKAKLEDQAAREQFVDRPPPGGNPGTYNRFWVDAGTKVVATRQT